MTGNGTGVPDRRDAGRERSEDRPRHLVGVAASLDAAYPVGLTWAIQDDRVIGPVLTVGFPEGMDRGVLALAATDSGWSVYAVGPASWSPIISIAKGDDDDEAMRRVEAAAGSIPDGATVEAVIANLHLVAVPDDVDGFDEDTAGRWAAQAQFGSVDVVFHPAWDARLLSQLVLQPAGALAVPEGVAGPDDLTFHATTMELVRFWADGPSLLSLLRDIGSWDLSIVNDE